MPVAVCPKPETLAAFARGDLGAAELAEVAGHVGSCVMCCRALQLVPEDTLAGLARAAAAAPSTLNSAGPPAPPSPESIESATNLPPALANHSRYRILGELGRGGMGVVYKAEHRLMDRVVALKVVAPQLTAKRGAVERFIKEFKAAGKLHHPNIITYHDAEEAGGAHFLVMEFVEGVSLDRLVAKKGPLPVPMACVFARQAALGLQHAADKGMVHRDIKPQNLMVTRKGQLKILDFGLARFAQADGAEEPAPGQKLPFGAAKAVQNAGVTNPNLLMGTPDYLSPEQAKNSHDVDPRSDIYSLGCTLYFLLTGKPPFITASTLIDKLLAHTHEEPPAIREERFEVTQGLADVLAKMMAKKPEDRYETAKEAADALLPFTRSDSAKEPAFEIVEAVPVAPAPVLVATPVVTPAPAAELAFDTDPQPNSPTLAEVAKPKKKKTKKRGSWWQRRKWAVLGGSAGLILLVGAVIAASSGKKPIDKPDDPNAGETTKLNPPQGKGKGKDGKGTSGSGNTVITPGKTVLFVLPSDGVYLPDFQPVRARLEELKVPVKTCSGEGWTRPHGNLKADPVTLDYSLRDIKEGRVPLRDIHAIIFCGYRYDEYTGNHPKSYAAGELIKKFVDEKKVVAAICVGQGVLVEHGVLREKEAARSPTLLSEQPQYDAPGRKITWKKVGVVTDGKIVTAARPDDAKEFADAVVEAIK